MIGVRIGRLRVIFRLPSTLYGVLPAPSCWPKEALAYVVWFSRLKSAAEDDHNMYLVTKPTSIANNQLPLGDIIPLSSIRQTCQLLPDFTREGFDFDHSNALDRCRRFFLNSYSSKYTYQSVW